MTGMTKPTFPTASLIVQAAMAAAFLVGVTGVARAQAVIKDDGGLVQWTIGLSGTSAASGVSAVNLPQGGGNYNGTISNAAASFAWAGTWYGQIATQSYLQSPSGPVSLGGKPFILIDTAIGGNGTGTLSLLTGPQKYFGALINSWSSSINTLSFYNGSTLLDTINVTGLGAAISGVGSYEGVGTDYASYLNVDFLGGASYNKVVLSVSNGTANPDALYLGQPYISASPVSLTSLTSNVAPTLESAPLPALGGTSMGLLALAGCAIRGLRRGKLRAA